MSSRHRHAWWSRYVSVMCGSGYVLCGTWLAVSLAQVPTRIIPDGSLGTTVTQTSRVHTIVGGTIRGTNLFHSFDRFDVGTGDTARFTTIRTGIENILSRVTGGHVSNIDGTIRSKIPGANLYLLNPSGAVFGPNARLDVNGSFHVSTADELRFADGYAFRVVNQPEPLLTAAPPAAFGFLSLAPAKITVQGSTLEAQAGQSLSLIGGDVVMRGATLTAGGPGGTVTIRGRRFEMTENAQILANAAGSPDGSGLVIDVHVSDAVLIDSGSIFTLNVEADRARDVAITAGTAMRVTNGGFISTQNAGSAGGNIHIDVGRLTLTGGGSIQSLGSGTGQGGAISVRARDEVAISGNFLSRIQAASTTGRTGSITVSTPRVVLDGGSIQTQAGREGGTITLKDVGRLRVTGQGFVQSFALPGGQAGDVTITATDAVSIADGGFMSSLAAPGGTPGHTVVQASSLLITGGTLGAFALPDSAEAAGDVTIEVATLSLTEGGQIVSGTAGGGAGGAVTISASESIAISGQSRQDFRSGILSATLGSGHGGRVRVSTPQLTIDGGGIFTDAQRGSTGNAGDVVLQDIGTLTLTNGAFVTSNADAESTGDAGNVTLDGGTVTVTGGSFISTTTSGPGKGGILTITAREAVSISGPGDTLVAAATLSRGAGGQIVIAAPVLHMDGGSITALTGVNPDTGETATGRAGDVSIEVDRLNLAGGALIDSRTTSEGRGGSVQVTVRESAVITGNSGLTTVSSGRRAGGNVELRAKDIRLSDGGFLSAESSSTGNAGNITLVTDTFLSENSAVTTAAEAAGGGNITLTGGQLVRLTNSNVTAEARGEAPDDRGGNVTVNSPFVILDRSLIQANAFAGNGGNITVNATEAFLTDTETCAEQACLNASSELGVAGTVAVSTPTADLSGVVTPLPQTFTQVTVLLPQRCAERLQGQPVSTFVLAGRDSLPTQPGNVLPSPRVVEGSERTQRGPDKARGPGMPIIPYGNLGVDAHGRPRVQGWPVHGLASLAWDAACTQGYRGQEVSRKQRR